MSVIMNEERKRIDRFNFQQQALLMHHYSYLLTSCLYAIIDESD